MSQAEAWLVRRGLFPTLDIKQEATLFSEKRAFSLDLPLNELEFIWQFMDGSKIIIKYDIPNGKSWSASFSLHTE